MNCRKEKREGVFEYMALDHLYLFLAGLAIILKTCLFECYGLFAIS